jgi:hypothetical protein
LLYNFYWNVATHDRPINTEQQEFFRRCLEVGNTKLITQFDGKVYEQLNGLAMGVADSPDLANLYGYYFENRAKVLEHPSIFFYGRYIDDCLAIVYAESVESAVDLVSSTIKFDNCVIEWSASDSFQHFLDMTLYKDQNNTLQHMPYRKAGNHQERIPWISAHPYDVKRGTFLGEMSRLATLSSVQSHYTDAMRSLVALYINRGYPSAEVHKWLYSNLAKRWDNRLTSRDVSESANVLVLKTQYNTAWNYFNSTQLGDTIMNYWREWLDRADRGDFTPAFPAPSECDTRVSDWQQSGLEGRWDLRNTDIFNKRVILSRKRTRNILDLTNTWKKCVFQNLEEEALADIVGTTTALSHPPRPFDYDINTQVVGQLSRDDREDQSHLPDHVRFRSSSPAPISHPWRSGAMGQTWGRGTRP